MFVPTSNSERNARTLAAAAVVAGAGAGALAVAGALAAPASAAPRTKGAISTASVAAVHPLQVTRIAYGDKLHHSFLPNGKGTAHTETLTSPDDVADLYGNIFVTFQNGVGPQGQASKDGNLDRERGGRCSSLRRA